MGAETYGGWFEGNVDERNQFAIHDVFLPLVTGKRFVNAGAMPLDGTAHIDESQPEKKR